jgi:hypothetical protein
MNWLMFLGCWCSQVLAGEVRQQYAPQFILSSFNNQTIMDRFGSPDIRLSQLVGYNSQKKIHKVVLIFGEEEFAGKDIKSLKKIYKKAREKKIEFVFVTTPTSATVSKTVRQLKPSFPVLKDPFQVVRNRYEHVQSQYCYVIDVYGKMEKQACADINDIKALVE